MACVGPGVLDSSEGSGPGDSEGPPFDPCATEKGTDGGWHAVPLEQLPGLQEVGGSAVVDLEGHRIIVAQIHEGCFAAVGRICTHQGCVLEYRGGERFVCPCHGAAFLLDGRVQTGPTSVPVAGYPAVVEDDQLWLQLP